MESKCTFYGMSRDIRTNKIILSFLLDTFSPEADLNGELRLTVRRWKERRSLDANGYMWVLLTKMALSLNTSKEEVYEEMLNRYGVPFTDEDGGHVVVGVNKSINLKRAGHWKHYKDDEACSYWYLLKGTSEYDTAEMSAFLDRVIDECKEMGIETASPDEIERIKNIGRI